MVSEIQSYEQDRRREGRRRARQRAFIYCSLIAGCFAFWAGVILAFAAVAH